MQLLIFVLGLVLACFGVGALLGATYVPTRQRTAKNALKLLNLRAGDNLLDLGSGSGGLLRAAAQKGIRGYGYEVNPILYLISKWRTRAYGDLVNIKLADFWHQDWPDVNGIYVFLTTRFMDRLDKKIRAEVKQPTRVVSYAYKLPHETTQPPESGLFPYLYQPSAQTVVHEVVEEEGSAGQGAEG